MSAYRRAGGSVILGYVTALFNFTAEIAQLVEHNLAKVGVASSSLVFRSEMDNRIRLSIFCLRETTASASAPVGCFAGSLSPDSGRNRRGLLAGLRCRGLRPDHFCEVAFAGNLYLSFGLSLEDYDPLGRASRRHPARRIATSAELVAPSTGDNPHPSGVLLAASTPNAACDPKNPCDPGGRAPDAAPSRRAPLALLVASPPASDAG